MKELKIVTYRADITPPIGHPLCAGWYPPCEGVADRLSANGIVLIPDGQLPIVLCALDWAELSNGEHELWRKKLARAACTEVERVALQCIHCHDAPWPDREAQSILDAEGYPDILMQQPWCDDVISRVAIAVGQAVVGGGTVVTEVRSGRARVHEIASNRRVVGADGKVRGVRWTRCRDASLRAEPEGLIDPYLKTISFHSGERTMAVLHYYAVHPTSHDGTGQVTCDFVGLARDRMAEREGVPHIYFTECAGDITTGKYNDGEADYRKRFTQGIFEAMLESSRNAVVRPVETVEWRTVPVILPPREDLTEEDLFALIRKPKTRANQQSRAALALAYLRRCEAGQSISLGALHLGSEIVIAHTPGEAFMEYQLHAQSRRPGTTVAVASYGDCGPGYITLARSFAEGGYEPIDSFCSASSENILREALERLVRL